MLSDRTIYQGVTYNGGGVWYTGRMRKRKRIVPYIFLSVLGVSIVFLVGVRYGKTVRTTDDIASYILSITPSPTIQPTLIPTIGYVRTLHACGVSFTVPTNLEKRDYGERSSIYLNAHGEQVLDIACEDTTDLFESLMGEGFDESTHSGNLEQATDAIKIDAILGDVSASSVATDEASVEYYQFIFDRPEPDITITVQAPILPLLQDTIAFD